MNYKYIYTYAQRKAWAKAKQNAEFERGLFTGILASGAIVGYYFVLTALWSNLWK